MADLDGILVRLERLELEAENATLRQEVSELRIPAPSRPRTAAVARAADGPVSRRALLGAGVGAVVATAASALGRPAVPEAANGGTVILGSPNTASQQTSITSRGRVRSLGTPTW